MYLLLYYFYRLFVIFKTRVQVFSFPQDPKLLFYFDTRENPKGEILINYFKQLTCRILFYLYLLPRGFSQDCLKIARKTERLKNCSALFKICYFARAGNFFFWQNHRIIFQWTRYKTAMYFMEWNSKKHLFLLWLYFLIQ